MNQPSTRNVTVNLDSGKPKSRSYTIKIGPGELESAGSNLAEFISHEHVVVFTDENVAKLYLDPVIKQVQPIAERVDSIVVPAGETSKSVSQMDKLWQQMVSLKADRKTVAVALGGGVVGDLAGFVAASFGRGVRFIQIPTTLLAQVDSSVGGKVGINLPTSKNMVGAFWQPQSVLIDPCVLDSLDAANYAAGLAEVIKYGLIMDIALFQHLESNIDALNARDSEILTETIAWCCECKAKVVEEDETEVSGRRAILNYGHTYGHAIESIYGYGKYLHGEAISIGMTCAGRLARNLGMVDQAFLDRQTRLFNAVNLPTECPDDQYDQLIDAMNRDKKVSRGTLNLILPTEIGNVVSVAAPDDDTVKQSLFND